MISENTRDIRKRIEKSANLACRNIEDITLVSVTKGLSVDNAREAINCGISDLGENRIQEALKKYDIIGPSTRWHMIGHLQTNKAKDAVRIFDLIHSVDSLRLAEQLDKEAKKINKIQDVLIQVNTSGESTKFGVKEAEVEDLVRSIARLKNLEIKGLMTMAPPVRDPEETRPFFRKLRLVSERIASLGIDGVVMHYLSMGMSQDFEVAIEEGSNMVRIGSAIFKNQKSNTKYQNDNAKFKNKS